MHFSTETICRWTLTAEEDAAVLEAIRQYLAMPQAGDAVSDRRSLVLGTLLANRGDAAIPLPLLTAALHPLPLRAAPLFGPDIPPSIAQLVNSEIIVAPVAVSTQTPVSLMCRDLTCTVVETHTHNDDGTVSITPASAVPKPPAPDVGLLRKEAEKLGMWTGVKLATPEGPDR